MIHAGDIVDNGDKKPGKWKMEESEMTAFTGDWGLNGGDGLLQWPVRQVHGNHDSPQGDGRNPLFPFPDGLFSVFSSLGEKANS